ncbi:hypothetical protein ACIBSV_29980 [Embleya sp. NPDC050154]|uniref:hypothetical protein n=1 Tax=Embleya sp. NPDC050154 TaxID=3363988 RepID=UPI0037A1C937
MNQLNPPEKSGRRNVRAARRSPLATTLALLPRLRAWADGGALSDARVARVSSVFGEDWLGNLAPFEWTTAAPTVMVGATTLNLGAEGIGRLDGAFRLALTVEAINDSTAVLARSRELALELPVFADQRRAGLTCAAHLPADHPDRSLIPPGSVEAALALPAETVVWSMGPMDMRVEESGIPWLLGCGMVPAYGPFGANLADVVTLLGRHELTCDALREAVRHYNKGLTAVLGDGAPYLTEGRFAVLLEMAATGPVASDACASERWTALRPDGFNVLVLLGLTNLPTPGGPS